MDDEEYDIPDEEYYIDDRPRKVSDRVENMSREELEAAYERIMSGKHAFEDEDDE